MFAPILQASALTRHMRPPTQMVLHCCAFTAAISVAVSPSAFMTARCERQCRRTRACSPVLRAVSSQQNTVLARLAQVEPAFELEADAVAAVTATRQALFPSSEAASIPSACKDLCKSNAMQCCPAYCGQQNMRGKVALDGDRGSVGVAPWRRVDTSCRQPAHVRGVR